jgi:hypothetical protein
MVVVADASTGSDRNAAAAAKKPNIKSFALNFIAFFLLRKDSNIATIDFSSLKPE